MGEHSSIAPSFPSSSSSSFIGYSLWLCPPSASFAETRLTDVITRMASLAPGTLFEPHVTLLPGIPLSLGSDEVIRITREGVEAWRAAGTEEVDLRLGGLEQQQVFFRALYSVIVSDSGVRAAAHRLTNSQRIRLDRSFP